MYEALIAHLRECAKLDESNNTYTEAADAIEELNKDRDNWKANVREVVYCKDCRHRDPEDHKCDCGGTERQGCPFKVADDYFCAYGER